MPRLRWLVLVTAVIAASAVLLGACAEDDQAPAAAGPAARTATDAAGAASPAAATAIPTPTPEPQRACRSDPSAHEARLFALQGQIEAAMEAFEGDWGFALIDLDCASTLVIRPDYVQYTASAGKLPFLIAALRKAETGDLALDDIRDDVELVFRTSDDLAADRVAAMVSPDDVRDVFVIAGVSEATRFVDSWRNLSMTALDLARVWEALLRGRLLGPTMTEYVLDLAASAEIPEEYATFPDPSSWDVPGLRYGQKAGYYVSDGVPYFFVGAGYLVPGDGSSAGWVAVLLATTEVEDLFDPPRREVFPLVLEYVQGAAADLARP